MHRNPRGIYALNVCWMSQVSRPSQQTMTSPTPLPSSPRPPTRKGPNPFLVVGLVIASTLTFMALTQQRKGELKDRPKMMADPLIPPPDYKKEVKL